MAYIRCLKPPLINRKEGVRLWDKGDTAEIEAVTGYWQGMIERGVVEVVEAEDGESTKTERKPLTKARGAKRLGR